MTRTVSYSNIIRKEARVVLVAIPLARGRVGARLGLIKQILCRELCDDFVAFVKRCSKFLEHDFHFAFFSVESLLAKFLDQGLPFS
jgi:hypothetical protein